MSSFLLGWRNHIFAETGASITATDGTVTVGALSALQDMRLSRRVTVVGTSDSDGDAAVEIEWTIPSGLVSVDLLGLMNYEVIATGAFPVTVSLIASGPGGSYQSSAVWSRPTADFPQHLWALCDARVEADTINLQVSATFGGFGESLIVTAGGLWAGPAWTPPAAASDDGPRIEAAWSQAIVDRGTVGRSEGGQGYPRRRQRYRSFEGRLVKVPYALAYGDSDNPSLLDIQQLLYRVGSTDPVVLFPRTKDASGATSLDVMHRLGIYGHMAETGRIEHVGGDYYQWTGVRVDELM